jgi:signal peptidase I
VVPVTSVASLVVVAVIQLFVSVGVPCLVIMRVFGASPLRALQAWLPTLLVPVVTIGFVLLLVRPLLAETFVCAANSMAPTLLGNHWQQPCPTCGGPAFCRPEPPGFLSPGRFASGEGPSMICRDHFHITEWTGPGGRTLGPDRFVVAKFLTPRRWDIIIFRLPEEPETLYVKRLVGMPGEEITIADGRVCADGQPLVPPESIGQLHYVAEMPDLPIELWGSAKLPARLGDDEYFVLGDFTTNSKDSRLWQRGAPGHPCYAVPASYIYGVVTNIYWPPKRWRTFR